MLSRSKNKGNPPIKNFLENISVLNNYYFYKEFPDLETKIKTVLQNPKLEEIDPGVLLIHWKDFSKRLTKNIYRHSDNLKLQESDLAAALDKLFSKIKNFMEV